MLDQGQQIPIALAQNIINIFKEVNDQFNADIKEIEESLKYCGTSINNIAVGLNTFPTRKDLLSSIESTVKNYEKKIDAIETILNKYNTENNTNLKLIIDNTSKLSSNISTNLETNINTIMTKINSLETKIDSDNEKLEKALNNLKSQTYYFWTIIGATTGIVLFLLPKLMK